MLRKTLIISGFVVGLTALTGCGGTGEFTHGDAIGREVADAPTADVATSEAELTGIQRGCYSSVRGGSHFFTPIKVGFKHSSKRRAWARGGTWTYVFQGPKNGYYYVHSYFANKRGWVSGKHLNGEVHAPQGYCR